MIRNIWAVGRNYADHAKELGNSVPTQPMIFLKAGSCASLAASEIKLPEWSKDVHHEIELALRFDQNLQISDAAVAIDVTERAFQAELKAKGHPWTLAKSFKDSCPLSAFFPVKNLEELKNLNLVLKVNDEVRQNGNTAQMIFSLQTLVDFVLTHFPVTPGDVLLTGTPAGVGAMKSGDILEAEIAGKVRHMWKVV
ncbi:MAG: fumarylacetoacetate hydrolase family protein [Bdellovibrio sp.]|nr:fumarylacetoacetate hydrolase family protein [Bdellovibrio sp.]